MLLLNPRCLPQGALKSHTPCSPSAPLGRSVCVDTCGLSLPHQTCPDVSESQQRRQLKLKPKSLYMLKKMCIKHYETYSLRGKCLMLTWFMHSCFIYNPNKFLSLILVQFWHSTILKKQSSNEK